MPEDNLYAQLCESGGVCLDMKLFDEAIAYFSEAIRVNPKEAVAYNNRGIAHAKQGHFRRAIGNYNKAIELDPSFAPAYLNRSHAHVARNDYPKALSDLRTAEEVAPDAYKRFCAEQQRRFWLSILGTSAPPDWSEFAVITIDPKKDLKL